MIRDQLILFSVKHEIFKKLFSVIRDLTVVKNLTLLFLLIFVIKLPLYSL